MYFRMAVKLNDKELSMMATLYGDVQVDEGVSSRLAKLFLTSMAPGTVSSDIHLFYDH